MKTTRWLPLLTAVLFGWKPLFIILAIALPLSAILAVCLLQSPKLRERLSQFGKKRRVAV